MDNRSSPLWDGNRETPKDLRLPNTPPSRLLKEENKTNTNTTGSTTKSTNVTPQKDNNLMKSSLSVDAPEFYPSYYKTSTPVSNTTSSIQERLKRHKVAEPNSVTEPVANDFESNFIGSSDDNRLKHLIDTLTKDPGQFSDLLDIFMDTLCPYFEDIFVLSRAALLLVEQVIFVHYFFYISLYTVCCRPLTIQVLDIQRQDCVATLNNTVQNLEPNYIWLARRNWKITPTSLDCSYLWQNCTLNCITKIFMAIT